VIVARDEHATKHEGRGAERLEIQPDRTTLRTRAKAGSIPDQGEGGGDPLGGS